MSDHTFSTRETASLLDLTPAEVRRFARAGLAAPTRDERGRYRFGFRDLVVLRMAAGLRRARVPTGRVAGALAGLRAEPGRELAGTRLEALGAHVVVRDGEVVWRADSGQLQLGLETEAQRPPEVSGEARTGPVPDEPRHGPEPDEPGRGPAPDESSDTVAVAADAETWLERAVALEHRDADAALAAYRRTVELDPDRWEAHAGLGFLLQEMGRPAEAVAPYRRALALDPDATVAFNLGVALDDLGRDREAESAYREALALEARLADAHFNLSCLYERRGDRAAALRHMIAYRESVGD